jgi:ABC-type transport system substrate-binding protein
MIRRTAVLLALLAPLFTAAAPPAASPGGAAAKKTLRVSFAGAENGFDPAQISDTVSAALVGSLFEAPLSYDVLARPVKLVPQAAVALPEVDADHTRFVFRIRPGNFFPDDPAFKGAKRELVAEDFVYSVKRYYDPAVRSPTLFHYENAGLLGLSELRRKAIADKTPFPYDTPVDGIRALDRYTFEVRTSRPAPRLPYVFASPALAGALAREVVEANAGKTMEHPVGTGPFRLAQWTRASRIVLERNPNHQGVFEAEPAPDDRAGQAIAAKLRGRKLPMLDRVEIAVIEETQPRWLAFLRGDLDAVAVPDEFIEVAAPNRRLAPNLAKQGMQLVEAVLPVTIYSYFAMENPVVGGTTPDKVALRRAIALAYDTPREIALVRKGRPIPAQSIVPPGVSGFDPTLKTEASDHDPARARALLDLYGYVDRDGDGWREKPDGTPLVLEYTVQPGQLERQLQSLWLKSMRDVGIRIVFKVGSWQENIKASRAGKLMMWGTGWAAALPDGGYFLDVLYGPNKGMSNHARFAHPRFDAIYEQQRKLPDGPQRDALIAQAVKLSIAYMPIKPHVHNVAAWLTQPGVVGYRPHPFVRDTWRHVDLEPAAGH